MLAQRKPPRGAILRVGHPMARNLEACYLFNEGTGSTLFDYSRNGRNGTMTACTWASTAIGPAVLFNGTTSLIDCGADWIGTGADSFSAWIYPTGWGESNFGRVLSNGKTVFNVSSLSSGILRCRSDGSTEVNSASGSITLAAWNHVAASRTAAGVANLYVNGSLSGTANQGSGTPAAGTTNVIIGNSAAADHTFAGYIACVKHWSRVLTASEFAQDHARPYDMFAR